MFPPAVLDVGIYSSREEYHPKRGSTSKPADVTKTAPWLASRFSTTNSTRARSRHCPVSITLIGPGRKGLEPQLNLNGLFVFLASVLSALSFAVAIVVVAISRDHWGTFKRMGLAWVTVFVSGIAVAMVLGHLFDSRLVTGLVTSTSIGVASATATVMGVRHVRAIRE